MSEVDREDVRDVSPREAEVLAAVCEHLSNAEISTRLFISVRTVESHVTSMLRKSGADNRRGLIDWAQATGRARSAGRASRRRAPLPTFVTPLIGRESDRAALAALLVDHRLVTAVGPGGIGKTRLTVAVAAEIADRYLDGACYVDLVPVTDPALTAATLAAALGLGDDESPATAVTDFLANKQLLLVLDNCEHLQGSVAALLEVLLARSSGLTVLATSRARLVVPFERAFPVPGLSVDTVNAEGDAVDLFLARAPGSGSLATGDAARRVARVCEALDGSALAIELAAARLPTLGLDGLESGLTDHLGLLVGGARADDRHRSLRSTLDWSYGLLDGPACSVLRRVALFAAPFTAAAAADVTGVAGVAGVLGHLADQSLLRVLGGHDATRYQALETVRQYGEARLRHDREYDDAVARHLQWCLTTSAELETATDSGAAWQPDFDATVADLRVGLQRASARERHRDEGLRLALSLARLLFLRGFPAEAQQRFEQAAALATDDPAVADALRHAGGAAEARHHGDAAIRLRAAAADVALRAGDRASAAYDLARNAEIINRGPGLMREVPGPDTVEALLARARNLASGDPRAQARVAAAEAFQSPVGHPDTPGLVERAVVKARAAGDPLTESAALDQLAALQLAEGELGAALDTSVRRTEVLRDVRVDALTATEHFDALIMAAECAVAAGDLTSARTYAERLRDLAFYRDEGHLGSCRLLLVTFLSGDWREAVPLASAFLDGWQRAGRPRAGNLSRGAYAAATLHGLRGDDDERDRWLGVVDALTEFTGAYSEFFDGLLLLHRGDVAGARAELGTSPERLTSWDTGLWRPWHAALWAEAAVLSRAADAVEQVRRAHASTRGNPITTALVARAAALIGPDTDRGRGLAAAAAALRDSGSGYQWARTLVMLGGAHRQRGEAALATMGATPMIWPVPHHDPC